MLKRTNKNLLTRRFTKELVNCVSENFSSWGNPTITVCREIIFLQVQKTRMKHFMAWVDFTYWLCRNPPSKHYPLYALYFRFSGISLIVIQVKSSMLPSFPLFHQTKQIKCSIFIKLTRGLVKSQNKAISDVVHPPISQHVVVAVGHYTI